MRLAVAALATALAAQPVLAVPNNVHLHKRLRTQMLKPPPVVKPPVLIYYGGAVIPSVKIVAIFWGPKVDSTTTSQVGAFYADFVVGPMFDWLKEYNTPKQQIGHGSFASAVTITPKAQGTTVTDVQIQAEIKAQLAAHKLPAADGNTLYMIHFPKGMVIKQGKQISCKDFCAYHGTVDLKTFYGVVPDQNTGTGCDLGCGSNGAFGNLTVSASHEIVEAVTDAQVGLVKGNNLSAPLAWYDSTHDATGHQYGEIGDICAAYATTFKGASGKTWNVQKEWSNKSQGCIADPGDKPQAVAASSGGAAGKAAGKKVVPVKARVKKKKG